MMINLKELQEKISEDSNLIGHVDYEVTIITDANDEQTLRVYSRDCFEDVMYVDLNPIFGILEDYHFDIINMNLKEAMRIVNIIKDWYNKEV